jgi:hypothetical protein
MGWEEIYRILEEKAPQLAKEVGKNIVRWEILFFYTGNPFSLFTAKRLSQVLGRKREDIDEALEHLVKTGFIRQIDQSGELPPIYEFSPDVREQETLKELSEVRKLGRRI